MGSFDFPQLITVESVIPKADAAATEAWEGREKTHSFDKCLPPHDSLSGPGLPHCTRHPSQGDGQGIQIAASLKDLGVSF